MRQSAFRFPVLLLYDCTLTSTDEWELVWRRRMNISSWLFVATSVAMAAYIIDVCMTMDVSVSR